MERGPSDGPAQDRPRLRDLMNLPGAITLARFPLAVAFLALLSWPSLAIAAYILGLLCDLVDGALARRAGTQSAAGALADGLADKTLHVFVAVGVIWLGLAPSWWAGLWFAREISQLVLLPFLGRALRGEGPARKSLLPGKIATFTLAVSILAAVFEQPAVGLVFAVATAASGVLATGLYLRRELRASGR